MDFGGRLPWVRTEVDLGMPRGEVRYVNLDLESSSGGSKTLETPPSSELEAESPDFVPESKKKRRTRTKGPVAGSSNDVNFANTSTEGGGTREGGIERAISVSLGTELDRTRMVTIPPTPPSSIPQNPPAEWMDKIYVRGKSIASKVRRQSFLSKEGEFSFEEDAGVLGHDDLEGMDVNGMEMGFKLDGSESFESEGSGEGKIRGEGSAILGEWVA